MSNQKNLFGIPLGPLGSALAEYEEKQIQDFIEPRRKIIEMPLSPSDRTYYLNAIDNIDPKKGSFKRVVEILLKEAESVALKHPYNSK